MEGVDWDLVVRILFALGIGGLIGLERERWHEAKRVLAGIRTMPLVALSGVLLVALTEHLGSPWLLVVGTAAMGLLTWQMAIARGKLGFHGFTTPMAFLITFLAGVVAGFGLLVEAAIIGVLTAVLLLEKSALHRFASVLAPEEIRSAILFLVLGVILLPIMPGGAIDPWGAVVPRQVLIVVLLVSAISFLGFVAMRVLGAERGLPASGVLAGFVNSTAATGSLAGLARDEPKLATIAVRAILLALAASVARNVAIAAIADPRLGLVLALLPFLLIMGMLLIAWAWLMQPAPDDLPPKGSIEVRSPFAWQPALRFAGLFVLFSLAAAGSQQVDGGGWVIYLTAVGGLVSTGAVVASMAVLAAQGTVSSATAAAVVLLGIIFSMIVKPVVVRTVHPPLLRRVLPPVLLAMAVGLVGAVWWAWRAAL